MIFYIIIIFIFVIFFAYLVKYSRYYYYNKSSRPIFILNKYDKLIYYNQSYKNFLNISQRPVSSLFSIFQHDVLVSKQLYQLKINAISHGTSCLELHPSPHLGKIKLFVEALDQDATTCWQIETKDFLNIATDSLKNDVFADNLLGLFPLPMAVLASDGKILTSNKNYVNLFSDKKAYFYDYLIEDAKLPWQNFMSHLAPGCNAQFESQLKDSGKFIKIFVYNSGDSIILAIIEVTQERALQEKITHTQKMQAIGELAGGIAHDFNNILTAVIMSCDFLLNNHRSSDPSYADIISIKQNSNRAAALVQQLLAFSRKQTLQLSYCLVTDIISDTSRLLMRLLGTNIKLHLNFHEEIWPVYIDSSSFSRVLMNLVINAKDAIGNKEGLITIESRNFPAQELAESNLTDLPSLDYVVVKVKDNGCGIEDKIKERIFDPFFTTKEAGKGTGLGLSSVYGIIKQTGGHIYCDSTLYKGTCFSIYLPAAKNKTLSLVNKASNRSSETEIKDLSGKGDILIIDDEDIVRKSFVRALKSRGYNILEASGGEQGIELFLQNKENIKLVICDVIMPNCDGPAVFSKLKQICPDLKFMFVSGFTHDDFREKYKISTEDYHFQAKPVSLKELAVKVKEILP